MHLSRRRSGKDTDAISRCITEDGVVRDEGLDYLWRDAIGQWKAAADAKYNVLARLGVRGEENKLTVRAPHWRFPG